MSNTAQILVSKSHCPYENLAIETHLLNTLGDAPILLLWQSTPAIIMGRAQNPWIECKTEALKEQTVKLCRRPSGGGCVYHDLGNLNLCFLAPKSLYCRKQHLALIVNALSSLGIEARTNTRHDLHLIRPGQAPAKISGSAFRVKKDRAFHHCTLLINTDLTRLNHLLNPKELNIESSSTRSVRSKVANLSEALPTLTLPQTIDALITAYQTQHPSASFAQLDPKTLSNPIEFAKLLEEFQSFDWIWARQPAFTFQTEFEGHPVRIKVNRGCIAKIDAEAKVQKYLLSLAGQTFSPDIITRHVSRLTQ